MKTVGEYIKAARVQKRYSLVKVERATKIKKEFIAAIENGVWEKLPEFPAVLGFVKNLAEFLDVSSRQAVAFLKRDYPPKVLIVNPKPDVENKFVWSPKMTFLAGVGLVLVVVSGYLFFQYTKFISPPTLAVSQPKSEEVVKDREITVAGKTDPDAVVRVNNQPFLVGENGDFMGKVLIFEGTNEIAVKAISRSGKETEVRVKIKPELGTK